MPEKSKEKIAGVIIHYFGKINVGIIKLKAELKVGDKIHIKGAHDDFTQVVKSMQFDHKPLSRASKGKEIGILVSQRVHENDKVYFAEK
ncbi:MAG: translation elongation factor-like protein [Candidatus Omnitrophica bacterium]|nr:translation elongation factor-like protein [Candidatus Omnitrophota bacterium]MBU1925911.1 translation elongation factor-like protein [Candidatus Omnitrophota bacterium]